MKKHIVAVVSLILCALTLVAVAQNVIVTQQSSTSQSVDVDQIIIPQGSSLQSQIATTCQAIDPTNYPAEIAAGRAPRHLELIYDPNATPKVITGYISYVPTNAP